MQLSEDRYSPICLEAAVWVDVLIRHGLLHAAVQFPTGHWLIARHAGDPGRAVNTPAEVLALVAAVQRRVRSSAGRTR
ncbi:hypothetical protein JGS22_015200 [Streptomyces sp. P38-E01]|uniref:Uncharacterized protein n=1 Tax=Streptomyces tardus TaxID=2780544 RepID=A0A949JF74_9ACTN|nr:hypothetical protein [Streptomyces tardus]MBU7598922.1 hypothetical protein [Streptomyces tardus]